MIVIDKVKKKYEDYENLNKELSNPDIINNRDLYQKKIKQHNELLDIVEEYKKYLAAEKAVLESKEIIKTESDPDMKEMAEQEAAANEEKLRNIEEKLKFLLLPKDLNDRKNAIIEIRAGTGGEEAALFAGELYKMYVKYAESHGFKIDAMDSHPTELGGFKEIIFMVLGDGAYAQLKFESGTHRVQRVPATEASGRVHTSAVTVAVLPEQEEVDVQVNPNDLRIDIFCASGPGGQCVNTTYSAVRIVHIPTGIEVSCQDERSQIKNKAKAMKILRARIKEKMEQAEKEKLDSTRKAQIGSGDRSEKIRTYNFPQNRVTDHRIGFTSYNLPDVMAGGIDEFFEKLAADFNQKLLEKIS